ncbi:hypothetical protein AHAS_Ahas03G0295100 [Arachis hypogaea]
MSKEEGSLGFRDMQSQNLAYLVKQAWKVITRNPDATWVKILKGIYFSETDFWKAKEEKGGSWAWKSIIQGRDFLKRKGRWSIGHGKSIKVREDNWIMGMSRIQVAINTTMDIVRDLIEEGGGWNENKIRQVFA